MDSTLTSATQESKASAALGATTALLIAANLVPLFGAVLLGWSVFELVALFWFENVVIGVLNAVRILTAGAGGMGNHASKVMLLPFFCFHYGMFTMVHGIFVVGLFGASGGFAGGMEGGMALPDLYTVPVPALLALVISHTISLAVHWFHRGERLRTTAHAAMFLPYGRVVVLHVVILGGGALAVALGSPVYALAMLVVLKIALDLGAHRLEHRVRMAEPQA